MNAITYIGNELEFESSDPAVLVCVVFVVFVVLDVSVVFVGIL